MQLNMYMPPWPPNGERWCWSEPWGCCFIARIQPIHSLDQIAVPCPASCRKISLVSANDLTCEVFDEARETKTFAQHLYKEVCPAGVVTWRVKWKTRPSVSAFASLNAHLHWPDRLASGKCHGRWWHQWAVMLRVKVFGHMYLTRLAVHANEKKKKKKKHTKKRKVWPFLQLEQLCNGTRNPRASGCNQ